VAHHWLRGRASTGPVLTAGTSCCSGARGPLVPPAAAVGHWLTRQPSIQLLPVVTTTTAAATSCGCCRG
jgi:hypothetical protein